MKRRDFARVLVGALILAARSAIAQPARRPARIGVLSSTNPETRSNFWDAFKDGMAKLGWVEGRDVTYVYRYTRGDVTRFDALAVELAAEQPDLLYGGTQAAALALKRATLEIPIVFAYVPDPVGGGLVASLSRPGGNATGLSSLGVEIYTKHVELLKEIQPKLRRIAVMLSTTTGLGKEQLKRIESAARAIGAEVQQLHSDSLQRISFSLDEMARHRPDGVLVYGNALNDSRRVIDRIAELRVPAVFQLSQYATAGGLVSYGAELRDNYRRAAGYADRILRGAKPADLPVEQPTTFELVVNLKTAKAQGITIPQSVLIRATRVIE